MSYPPPPGSASANPASASQPHPSLPARPPPSKVSGFKPAFSASLKPTSAAPSYGTAQNYAPTAAPGQYGPSYPSYGAVPVVSAAPYQPQVQAQAQAQTYQYPQQSYPAAAYSAPPAAVASYAAPQIRNPFPAPGTASDYDPETAAQIAQWQSAYVTKDTAGKGQTSGTPDVQKPTFASADATKPEKKKTAVREGGGKKWTDESLLEWDPAHLRLFVGNLAGEVTDESLFKAFSRWKSVQKSRVIRDKRTSKSKGYGFVSFSDPDDFFQAAKEMNGKYIQSHPVVVKKATTEIRSTNVKEKEKGKNHGGNNKNKNKNGAFEPNLGPMPAGVTKPGQKTKNGLRLLG